MMVFYKLMKKNTAQEENDLLTQTPLENRACGQSGFAINALL